MNLEFTLRRGRHFYGSNQLATKNQHHLPFLPGVIRYEHSITIKFSSYCATLL